MRREPVGRSDVLIERAVDAFRALNAAGQVLPSAAWFDLTPEDREQLFEAQVASRAMERVIDEDALSGTARVVLGRAAKLL